MNNWRKVLGDLKIDPEGILRGKDSPASEQARRTEKNYFTFTHIVPISKNIPVIKVAFKSDGDFTKVDSVAITRAFEERGLLKDLPLTVIIDKYPVDIVLKYEKIQQVFGHVFIIYAFDTTSVDKLTEYLVSQGIKLTYRKMYIKLNTQLVKVLGNIFNNYPPILVEDNTSGNIFPGHYSL